MSSQRNHVISCRVTEKLRLSLWTLWLFELDSVQLFEPHSDHEVKLVSVVKGMAAQAAAVLRDKRKRWEIVILDQFCAKLFLRKSKSCLFSIPTPALPVREEEAKRRWRRTLRYRSVTISPEKICPFRENLSVHSFKSFSILIFLSLRRSMWPLRWGAI